MILAADAPIDPSIVTPGLLGFAAFIALALATWFLVKSFNKQLKRIEVPPAEDEETTEPDREGRTPPTG